MKTKMNQLLSDLVVEYHKLQNFHWYVKGHDFFQVHAKLEEMYNYINVAIDEVAEAMLINQLAPHASLKDFLATSKIVEAPAKHVPSSHVWAEVHQDYSYLRDLCIAIKEKASKEEANSIEQLMDGYIAAFDKDLWMLSQAVDD